MSKKRTIPRFRIVTELDPSGIRILWEGKNPGPRLAKALSALKAVVKPPTLEILTTQGWKKWKFDPKIEDAGHAISKKLSEKLRSIRREKKR